MQAPSKWFVRLCSTALPAGGVPRVQSPKVKLVQICTDCSPNLSRRPVNTDRVSILKYLIVESAMHTWNILGNGPSTCAAWLTTPLERYPCTPFFLPSPRVRKFCLRNTHAFCDPHSWDGSRGGKNGGSWSSRTDGSMDGRRFFFFFKFTMAGFRYSMTRIRKRNFVRRILLENRVNLIRSIRRGLKLERIIEGCREFL